MDNMSIKEVCKNGLCIACGMCAAVCPTGCIELKETKGNIIPCLNEKECSNCGRCYRICPGKGTDYIDKGCLKGEDFWFGSFLEIYSVRTKNIEVLKESTSGGFITETVSYLLNNLGYDCAFLVGNENYEEPVIKTEIFKKEDLLNRSQKSRYVTVSHFDSVKYMLSNREKRIIFVGTSCMVHGLLNTMREYKLNRDNYFFIGLFCDATMTMNVIKYFRNICGKDLMQLYFRDKSVGGWPGGVKIVKKNGTEKTYSNKVRMRIKEYFRIERCLYCLDKLNMFADISVGDDYNGCYADQTGGNTIIIRTEKGKSIFSAMANKFEYKEMLGKSVYIGQGVDKRKKNLAFQKLKSKNIQVPIDNIPDSIKCEEVESFKKEWIIKQRKLEIGKEYDKQKLKLKYELFINEIKKSTRKIIRKYNMLKERIHE